MKNKMPLLLFYSYMENKIVRVFFHDMQRTWKHTPKSSCVIVLHINSAIALLLTVKRITKVGLLYYCV